MLYKHIQGLNALNNGISDPQSSRNNTLFSSTARKKSITHAHEYANKKSFKDYLDPYKARSVRSVSDTAMTRSTSSIAMARNKKSDQDHAPKEKENILQGAHAASVEKSSATETTAQAQAQAHAAEDTASTLSPPADADQNTTHRSDIHDAIDAAVQEEVPQLGAQEVAFDQSLSAEHEPGNALYADAATQESYQELGAGQRSDAGQHTSTEDAEMLAGAEKVSQDTEGVDDEASLPAMQGAPVEHTLDAADTARIAPLVESRNDTRVQNTAGNSEVGDAVQASVSSGDMPDVMSIENALSDENAESHADNAQAMSRQVEQANVRKDEGPAPASHHEAQTVEFDSTTDVDAIVKHEAGSGVKVVRHDTIEQFASQQRLSQYLKSNGTNELVQQAKLILKQDKSGEVRITLHPREFGEVKMTFNIDNDKIVGRILVDSQIVKEAVQKNMDNLARQFSHQGFDVGGFFVTVDENTSDKNNEDWLFARNKEKNSMMNSENSVNEIFTYSYIGFQSDKVDIIA